MDVHQEWLQFEQAYRYMPKHSKEVERHYLKHLIRLLQVQGYTVLPCASNGHWDLTVGRDGQVIRVEVKISRPKDKPGRAAYYQFKLKSGGSRPVDGDVAICCCCPNGPTSMIPFIVPVEELGGRSTLEITSEPHHYAGRWARWRGAWGVLAERLG